MSSAQQPRRRRTPPQPPLVQSPNQLLTVSEVAGALRIGISTVWQRAKTGAIPQPIRVGPKQPRWRAADVLPQFAGGANAGA
ncbi:MAG: hypothetical protein SF002_03135 [Alphaproteobacteria bacterium]|nr:hypothetical protein [Alphaproteobacteria bacterium]